MYCLSGVEQIRGRKLKGEEIDEQRQIVTPLSRLAGCWQRVFYTTSLPTLKFIKFTQDSKHPPNNQDGGRLAGYFILYQHLRPHPLTSSLS